MRVGIVERVAPNAVRFAGIFPAHIAGSSESVFTMCDGFQV